MGNMNYNYNVKYEYVYKRQTALTVKACCIVVARYLALFLGAVLLIQAEKGSEGGKVIQQLKHEAENPTMMGWPGVSIIYQLVMFLIVNSLVLIRTIVLIIGFIVEKNHAGLPIMMGGIIFLAQTVFERRKAKY